jgi:predicted nucleic acid-binding protein
MSGLKEGTTVKIQGLVNAKELNGIEGTIMSFSTEKERYAVKMPTLQGSETKMLKVDNLEVLEEPPAAPVSPVFENEADMMANLAKMGMDPKMLANLTPEQKQKMFTMTQRTDIVNRAMSTHRGANSTGTMNPAAGGLYSWKDEKDNVYMEVNCKAEAKCKITTDSLTVLSVDEEALIDGKLFQEVEPEKCSWEIKEGEDGKKLLAITLIKTIPMKWLMVTR